MSDRIMVRIKSIDQCLQVVTVNDLVLSTAAVADYRENSSTQNLETVMTAVPPPDARNTAVTRPHHLLVLCD